MKRKARDFFTDALPDIEQLENDADVRASVPPTDSVQQKHLERMKELVRKQFDSSLLASNSQSKAAPQLSSADSWMRIGMQGASKTFILDELSSTGRSHLSDSVRISEKLVSELNSDEVYSIASSYTDTTRQKSPEHRSESISYIKSFSKYDSNPSDEAKPETTVNYVAGVDDNVPVYKKLKAGQRIFACYEKDGKTYPAVIKSVIHGGYSCAKCDVIFDGYEGIETIDWRNVVTVQASTASQKVVDERVSAASTSKDTFGREVRNGASKNDRNSNATIKPPLNEFFSVSPNTAVDTTNASTVETPAVVNPQLLEKKRGSWKTAKK